MKANYYALNHPDVRVGKRTQGEVMNEFIKIVDYFVDFRQIVGGKIVFQDFVDLYGFISASVDNDTYFEILLNSVWKLDGADYQASKQTSKMQSPHQEVQQGAEQETFSTPGKQQPNEEVKADQQPAAQYPQQSETRY